MESSEFITKTDSTTGTTCITNGNSFTLCGSLVNSCNYTCIEEIQNSLGVAHFNLMIRYDYEIFYAISNTKKSELCVVVVKDKEDAHVGDNDLFFFLSTNPDIRNLESVLRSMCLYPVSGVFSSGLISSEFAYLSFSYKMYPEEQRRTLRTISELSSVASFRSHR